MQKPLMIKLENDQEMIINEDQVCSVQIHENNMAMITMSNGQIIVCKSPSYSEWKNDLYIRT